MDLFDDSEDDEAPKFTETASEFEILGWEEASPLIKGLYVRRGYLTPPEQLKLETVLRETWIRNGMNQGMCFGKFPDSLNFLFDRLNAFLSALPPSNYPALTPYDEPPPRYLWKEARTFTQLIANYYTPGEGIKEHVDLRQFSEGIVSLSLLSSTPMIFRPVCKGCPIQDPIAPFRNLPEFKQHGDSFDDIGKETPEQREERRLSRCVIVWLHPGDLLVLQDEARWDWTHEIERKMEDPVPFVSSGGVAPSNNSFLNMRREPRMSLTMRWHNFNPETGRSRVLEAWEKLSEQTTCECECVRCLSKHL